MMHDLWLEILRNPVINNYFPKKKPSTKYDVYLLDSLKGIPEKITYFLIRKPIVKFHDYLCISIA